MKKFFVFLLFISTTISVGISLYLYLPYIKNHKNTYTTNNVPTATIANTTSTESNILSSNESSNNTFKIIHVPIINQFPELPSGCEIVATTMLLNWYGYKIDKLLLANSIKTSPLPTSIKGVLHGNDPNDSFIGDPFSENSYGVYHKPIIDLINTYTNNEANNLTGSSFENILDTIKSNKPVIMWATIDMKTPSVTTSWKSPNGTVSWIAPEHAYLLIGFDENNVIVNDPYDGTEKYIDKELFKSRWESLGSQAVSLK